MQRVPTPHPIPLSAPDIQREDIDLVTQVLRSGTLSGGPFTEALERDFADYIAAHTPLLLQVARPACTFACEPRISRMATKSSPPRSVLSPRPTRFFTSVQSRSLS